MELSQGNCLAYPLNPSTGQEDIMLQTSACTYVQNDISFSQGNMTFGVTVVSNVGVEIIL